MSYEQILYEVKDGVATITMNRPEKLNALTPQMGEEIYDAFRKSLTAAEVRAVILTGAGRGFCSGIDLSVLGDTQRREQVGQDFTRKFPLENFHSPKPTICAINGPAVGVGITMAVSFDMRVAAIDAKMAVPFAKLGILPGLGSSYLLPRLIGRGRTMDLLLSGRMFTGAEALEMGLVDRAVPAEQVLSTARELAQAMAACHPEVLAHCKRSLNLSLYASSLEQALEEEGKVFADLRAAKGAFQAKG
jgi:2-(1,2-epoxy-1,2-dihydrophenyl)acetyl-CoA isomerase